MVYYPRSLPTIRRSGVNRILYNFDTMLSILSKNWNLKINYSLDPRDVLSESEGKSFIVFEGISNRFSDLRGGSAYFVIRDQFIEKWKKSCRADFRTMFHLKNFEFQSLSEVIDNARSKFVDEFQSDRDNCTVSEFLELLGESIIESFKSVIQKIFAGGTRTWNSL